jgi:hypothetical protein
MQTRIGASEVLRRLAHLRARLGEQLLTWLTILLTVFTFMIVPLHAAKLIMVPGFSPRSIKESDTRISAIGAKAKDRNVGIAPLMG